MRILGVDVGRRRVGLAISDPSGTLARPLETLTVTDRTIVQSVCAAIERLAAEDEGLGAIVVGLPRHLDGSASEETTAVRSLLVELARHITIPIATEDERLTSREAESRLALRERDWRQRKLLLDAAAAAVILQDYRDRRNADCRSQLADSRDGDEPDPDAK